MNNKELQKFKLPNKPGVYFFLGPPKRTREGDLKGNPPSPKATDGRREILYIGKATSLRGRTKSYFAKDLISTRGPLIVDMVFKANEVKFEETDSVLEALILEANLIKKHQPYYNTKEKDDKSFNYVCITKESFPKVLVVRGKDLGESAFSNNVFGPFTSGPQLREAMKIIRKIFPFIDAQSAKRDNAEFYRQLGLAPDVSGNTAQKAYARNIRHIKLFFEGKKKKIISDLKKEMMQYAKKHQFERAGEIKRQIFALEHINDVALLKKDPKTNYFENRLSLPSLRSARAHTYDFKNNSFSDLNSTFRIEAYDIAHMSGKNMVGVMTVVENGQPAKNEYRKFNIKTQSGANDTGALLEVLERRFAHTEWPMPSLIVMDGGSAQLNTAIKFQKRVGLAIPLVSVVKDDRHKAKEVLGDKSFAKKYESEILLANSESHRFAIAFHKDKRSKSFLKK